MKLAGSITAGGSGEPDLSKPLQGSRKATLGTPGGSGMGRIKGASALFGKKNPGSGGKLGKTSGRSATLSKLRGKGALA